MFPIKIDAPFYLSNETLHSDLLIPNINNQFYQIYTRLKNILRLNKFQIILNLDKPVLTYNPLRRLKLLDELEIVQSVETFSLLLFRKKL